MNIDKRKLVSIILLLFQLAAAEAKDVLCGLEGYSRHIRVSLTESEKFIEFHNQKWAYTKKETVKEYNDLIQRIIEMTSFSNYPYLKIHKYTGINIGQDRQIDFFEVELDKKREWVFYGANLILTRCIADFSANSFQINLHSLEEGRMLAIDILDDAIAKAENNGVFNKIKEALIAAKFVFGDCYSKTATACVNLKFINEIRFNSKREIPIEDFYGSFTDPLLALAQTLIHETSHTYGIAEIEATQNELDVFKTASRRIPSYNAYAIKYGIMARKH